MQSRRIPTHLEAIIVGLAAVALLVLAGLFVGTEHASAHTPAGGADCVAGVHAEGHSYDAADTNTVSVSLDGVTSSHQFTTDGTEHLSIPQDGLPHAWSWSVTTSNPDPAFSASGSGSITCGTVVTPTPTPTAPPTTVPPTPSEPPTNTPPTAKPPKPHHPAKPTPPTRECIDVNTIKVTHADGSVTFVNDNGVCDSDDQPPAVEEGY